MKVMKELIARTRALFARRARRSLAAFLPRIRVDIEMFSRGGSPSSMESNRSVTTLCITGLPSAARRKFDLLGGAMSRVAAFTWMRPAVPPAIIPTLSRSQICASQTCAVAEMSN